MMLSLLRVWYCWELLKAHGSIFRAFTHSPNEAFVCFVIVLFLSFIWPLFENFTFSVGKIFSYWNSFEFVFFPLSLLNLLKIAFLSFSFCASIMQQLLIPSFPYFDVEQFNMLSICVDYKRFWVKFMEIILKILPPSNLLLFSSQNSI